MGSIHGLHYFYPLFYASPDLQGCQIIQTDQNKIASFVYFPLVGMVRRYRRYCIMDIGMGTVFLVCQISTSHLYAVVAIIYSGDQCALP
jgi:hypothetical protein